MIESFSISRLPRIEFGHGCFAKTAGICAAYGSRLLLVTGASSFQSSGAFEQLKADFSAHKIDWQHCTIDGEPSPQMVDDIVKQYGDADIEIVLGVGGGSALDAAKAIAGLLKVQRSVMDYLEGVGPELEYSGPAVPFIAAPTTAGTGSEATKNAVLSVQGKDGFKKSFRHDQLVAQVAIVDPALLGSCPPEVIAANGMDALTQLLESYVSTRANPMTDTLALKGLRAVAECLLPLYWREGDIAEAQSNMAFASMLSGICLAQTGLGSVHGLAAPLGAFFPIPHGVACGTLVAEATRLNIDAMLSREPNNPALDKYVKLDQVLLDTDYHNKHESWERLVNLLSRWTEALKLPRLSSYGVSEEDLDRIVANARGSSMKTNPLVLTDEELKGLLLSRL